MHVGHPMSKEWVGHSYGWRNASAAFRTWKPTCFAENAARRQLMAEAKASHVKNLKAHEDLGFKGSFWWEHVGATLIVPRCLQPSTSDSQKCEQLKSSAGSWHLSHSAAFGPSVRRGSVLDKEARCQRLWSRPPWHHVQCCYMYIYI